MQRNVTWISQHETADCVPTSGAQRLQQASSVFSFESHGEPPDRYALDFRGRGIARRAAGRSAVEFMELHQVEMRLPCDYPAVPPDLRWITPILHPNVSFSGFIQLRDLGLPWDDSVTLDVVCERLWDVARLAYMQWDRTTNSAARTWLEEQTAVSLPVDVRPLRDLALPAAKNVIRYQRRGAPPRPISARVDAKKCCLSAKILRCRPCLQVVRRTETSVPVAATISCISAMNKRSASAVESLSSFSCCSSCTPSCPT